MWEELHKCITRSENLSAFHSRLDCSTWPTHSLSHSSEATVSYGFTDNLHLHSITEKEKLERAK